MISVNLVVPQKRCKLCKGTLRTESSVCPACEGPLELLVQHEEPAAPEHLDTIRESQT